MGVSRSASTVIAYAMKEFGWPLEKAYNYVKQKRSITRPNAGFMRQLSEYEGILDARWVSVCGTGWQNPLGSCQAWQWPLQLKSRLWSGKGGCRGRSQAETNNYCLGFNSWFPGGICLILLACTESCFAAGGNGVRLLIQGMTSWGCRHVAIPVS